MDNYKQIDLLSINNGAAVDLFQEEFNKVMQNISDLSIASDSPREIKLVFKIKPNKNRTNASCVIQASSRLASVSAHEGSMWLSTKGAFVVDHRQMDFMGKGSQAPAGTSEKK